MASISGSATSLSACRSAKTPAASLSRDRTALAVAMAWLR